MSKYSFYLLAGFLMISQNGYSKSKIVSNKKNTEDLVTTYVSPVLPLDDDAVYKSLVEEAKKTIRQSANAVTDVPAVEKSFHPDFIKIRTELIGNGIAGDPNQFGVSTLKKFSDRIEFYSEKKNYDALDAQAKLVAIQLRALRPFKGFIFRAKHYINGISALRTMIVTTLRAQIAGIDAFFPDDRTGKINHWELVFRYLTENVPGIGPEIKSDVELYNFFVGLIEEYNHINFDLYAFTKSPNPIWWDNKLYMSFANFVSEQDRYIRLGKPEFNALYAANSATLSSLYSMTAYDFNGLQSAIKSVGQLYGIRDAGDIIEAQVKERGAQGMSSFSRISVLNKYPQLFRRVPDGKQRMKDSFRLLKTAVRAANISFQEAKKRSNDTDLSCRENPSAIDDRALNLNADNSLFDPRVALAFDRNGRKVFSGLERLVDVNDLEPRAAVSAVVSGETVSVTLRKFYEDPPEYLSDLFPTDWDLSSEGKNVDAPGYSGNGRYLRNYKYGMAKEWFYEPYQKLFPDLKGYSSSKPMVEGSNKVMNSRLAGYKRTSEVPKYARILSQTWGSSVFAIPLAAVIF